jgi:hypothetical protein
MSFVWRTGANGESHPPLSARQELGPRIGITCQLALGLVYFALVIRTFRNYGESGRKARVVRRLADVQIELEARGEWDGERDREDMRSRARESEEGTRGHGQSQVNDSARQTEKQQPNELGLSGMGRKQDVSVPENGDIPANDESFSSFGM